MLRPIGARALKSAGDTLRPYLAGARVLDLFAGNGRLGKMALVEGAEHVVFVERDERTGTALRKSLLREAGRSTVFVHDVFSFLASHSEDRYDLVFADPPFKEWANGYAERLALAVQTVLLPESVFVVKNPTRVILSGPLPGLSLWKQSEFGESTLTYFRNGARGHE